MVTGTKGSLLELKKQLESVYPIKARFDKERQGAESENMLGKTGILHQHDPRHVDVLVESLERESRNTMQTQILDDVKDEN